MACITCISPAARIKQGRIALKVGTFPPLIGL